MISRYWVENDLLMLLTVNIESSSNALLSSVCDAFEHTWQWWGWRVVYPSPVHALGLLSSLTRICSSASLKLPLKVGGRIYCKEQTSKHTMELRKVCCTLSCLSDGRIQMCREKWRDSRSGIGNVFFEGGQRNLSLNALSLCLST